MKASVRATSNIKLSQAGCELHDTYTPPLDRVSNSKRGFSHAYVLHVTLAPPLPTHALNNIGSPTASPAPPCER